MTLALFIIAATCFVAYSNGANDNFKGVATLFGSRTSGYRVALAWATATTFAGSVCSFVWAGALIENFSGKGLVPDGLAGSPELLLAVAVGAGSTVMLATLIGFPVSTTHGLTGALLGAGLAAVGPRVHFGALGTNFVLPLLLSPFAAIVVASPAYIALRKTRRRLGVTTRTCVCIGEPGQLAPVAQTAQNMSLGPATQPVPRIVVSTSGDCVEHSSGRFVGVRAQRLLDVAHYVSAGMVSFARGLNDTPKIVALMLAVEGLALRNGTLVVAVAMAVGGAASARRVAVTMSQRITRLNRGQGFTANIVTGLLVIASSRLGMPVSTTHVSVGSLFGIGFVNGRANKRVVSEIVMSWVLTLPVAAAIAGAAFWILQAR